MCSWSKSWDQGHTRRFCLVPEARSPSYWPTSLLEPVVQEKAIRMAYTHHLPNMHSCQPTPRWMPEMLARLLGLGLVPTVIPQYLSENGLPNIEPSEISDSSIFNLASIIAYLYHTWELQMLNISDHMGLSMGCTAQHSLRNALWKHGHRIPGMGWCLTNGWVWNDQKQWLSS